MIKNLFFIAIFVNCWLFSFSLLAQEDTTIYNTPSPNGTPPDCQTFSVIYPPKVQANSQAYLSTNGCSGAVIWFLNKPDGTLLQMGRSLMYKFTQSTTFYVTCMDSGVPPSGTPPGCQSTIKVPVIVPNGNNSTLTTTVDYEGLLNNLKNVVPPSPNASSLGKYGEIPVSLDRGVPNISVPITSIGMKGFTLPINLSFHTSGNKVGETASWVGLGATLNAGGVITRSVRGLADEGVEGYFGLRQAYPNLSDLTNTVGMDSILWQGNIVNVANGSADAEQDIYTLNYSGRTYHLLFKSDNSIATIPYSDLKITSNITDNTVIPANQMWTVTMEDGVKLIFGGSGCIETNTNLRFTNVSYSSSWYLKEILLPTGEAINFSYTIATIKQDTYFSEYDFIQVGQLTEGGAVIAQVGTTPKVEVQSIDTPHLSTIESDLMRIEFVTNNGRQDLDGGLSLSQINVFSKLSGVYTEKYSFDYEYSTASSSVEYNPSAGIYFGKRLRLTAFHKLSLTGGTPQTWTFSYYPLNLPSRRSYAQDHWGYYNGATANNTLLPSLSYDFSGFVVPANFTISPMLGFFPPSHNLGANREADGESMKAEVLTQITYPTKGFSQFTYEPNSIQTTKEVFQSNTLNLNLSASQPNTTTANAPFINTKRQNINVSFNFVFSASYLNEFGNTTQLATITLTTPSNGSNTSIGIISIKKTDLTNNAYSGSIYLSVGEIGTYTFNLNSVGNATLSTDYTLNSSLQYQQSLGNQSVTQLVGGLRIANMVDNDANGNTTYKSFQYENTFVISPDSLDTYVNTVNIAGSIGTSGATKVVRNSSTRFSLGSIGGGTVNYGKVSVIYGASGEDGKSVSEFTQFADVDSYTGTASKFPYPATDSRDFERGLLLSQTEYSASNVPFKKIVNTYDFAQKVSFSNFKSGYSTIKSCPAMGSIKVDGFCGLTTSYYKNTTFQVKHISTTETSYDLLGNSANDNLTNFYYDNANHTQQTRSETFESDNTKTTLFTNYPQDYAAGSGFIDNLVANHMFFPIESVKIRENADGSNTQILAGAILKYQANGYGLKDKLLVLDTSDPVALSGFKFSNATIGNKPSVGSFTSFAPDSRYVPRLVYDSYDSHNNLVSYHTQSYLDNVSNAFLWAYQGYYPIAEIKNAAWSNLMTGLSSIGSSESSIYSLSDATTIQSTMQSLRGNMTNTYLNSYAYTPFYGLSNLVSPHALTSTFTYDDFNRLRNIKDPNGNLTDLFQYQFASTTSLSPPTINVSGTTLCTVNLIASGCSGVVNWSNGSTGQSISVPTTTSSSVTATCTANGNTSTASNSLTIPTLPTGWSSADVGGPSTAGCTQYGSSSLTISGSGYDYNSGNGNTADAFHYVYETLSGDVTILAKLSSLIAQSGERAGIMFRSSNASNAQYFEIIQDGNEAVATLRRSSDGVGRDFLNYALNLPINSTWLQIVKTGNTFSALYSSDGSTWQTLTSNLLVGFGNSFQVGFVVYDDGDEPNRAAGTNQATFTNTTLNGQSF